MAQSPAHETPFDAFHQQLLGFTKKPTPIEDRHGKWWRGQEFVLYDQLRDWLVGPSSTPTRTNVDILLSAAYSKRDFPDLRRHQVTGGESRCLLVFCILIELNQAELIHDFYIHDVVDRRLPMPLHDLEVSISTMARHREIPASNRWIKELAYNFDQKQWKYRPVKFVYEDDRIWNEKYVFPFMGKQLITEKGGTSSVYEVTVPSCLVDERLQERIGKTEVKVDGIWVSQSDVQANI